MKLDLAKDLFRDSWSRRDQLTSSTGTPISVLTAVAGGIAVLIANYKYDCGIGTVIFILASAVSVLGLAASAFFITKSYHGYLYQDVPNAADLDSHCQALHAYHEAAGGSPQDAEADFDQYLAARFVEAADVNSRNNESKAAYLYRSTQLLIVGIVSTAVATVPWAATKLGKSEEPQRVTVETPVRVTLPPGALNAANQPSPPEPATARPSPTATPDTSSGRPAKSPGQRGRATTSATQPATPSTP